MLVNLIIQIIKIAYQLIFLVIIADALVSYFLPPYHKIRMMLDRIVDPMLAPIRRIVPPIQSFDLSPFIFLIIVIIIERLLISILTTIR
jgi:YggT family protein